MCRFQELGVAFGGSNDKDYGVLGSEQSSPFSGNHPPNPKS